MRLFNEELLLKFKENNSELLFEDIMYDKDLKSYVRSVCTIKMRSYPTALLTIDDFINIGYLVIWKCINSYKFICPVCKIYTKTEIMYKLHTEKKHGKFLEPKKNITEYIKFNLGAYLQNELRKEYSASRKSNIMTSPIFSPDDDTENMSLKEIEISIEDMENNVIFKNTINDLLKLFDDIAREIFIYLYKYNLKQIEIAKILFKQNRYASEKSAAVVVSRILKSKIYPTVREFLNSF